MQNAGELLTVVANLTEDLKCELYSCWDRRSTMIPWEESHEFKRCQALDKQYQELQDKYA